MKKPQLTHTAGSASTMPGAAAHTWGEIEMKNACSLLTGSRTAANLKLLKQVRSLALAAAIIFLLFLTTTAVSVYAQSVQGTGTDLHFHKFKPAVPPEQSVPKATSQMQGTTGMSAAASQQILALEQEKESRTPAQRKMDSNLLYTVRMLRGESAAPGVPFLYTGVDLDDHNNVVVDITANVTDQLLDQLKSAGTLILYSHATFRSIRAIIPPNQIENIAASPDVIFISPKVGSLTARNGRGSRSNASLALRARPSFELRAARVRKALAALLQPGGIINTGQGSVTTEGDAAHRAFDARGTFGVNGSGLKIGVLSDSVNATNAATLAQASGDLPPTCGLPVVQPCLTVLQDFGGGGDEGAAMLEIIYDMAPGASLFFATADVSEASFAQNILNLKAAGCDIIVDDVFYFDEPVFEDGIVAQAVSTVASGGALYFSSAGNEGNLDDGTAGYYEGDYVSGGAFAFPAGAKTGTIHNFGTVGAPVLFDALTSAGANAYILQWADPQGGSNNDYDLFVLSSGGAVKASSTDIQSGTQNPFEAVDPGSFALAAGDRLVVFQTSTASNRFFSLNTIRGNLAINTAGQTHGHSAASATGVFSVAATPAAAQFGPGYPTGPFPDPFSASNQVELFTSDGPRRVFFNSDGTAITPGDFSATGGTVRNKPDITAADGVSTTLPGSSGLNPFFGTSAAAPSAAAVAALIKSANPALTQAQIRTALTSTAIDIMGAGLDRDSGSGIVMAYEAVASLGIPGAANPELGTITATQNPGNGDGLIKAGEGAQLVIQLKNSSGVLSATGVTATLTTTTAGVTITQPNTTSYADLTAGTGSGNNLSPLTFTLASSFPCVQTINFTLTVSFSGGSQRVLSFSIPTGSVTLSNNLGTVPTAIPGLTTATGTQTNRISRNGVPSTCGVAKTFPGFLAVGNRAFDSYTFTATRAICVSPVLTGANAINLFEVAYSPSFDPTNIATNYAGDAGLSGSGQSCGISTVVGTSYTFLVSDVSGTSVGSNYSLQLPSCAFTVGAINQVPIALAHDVTVSAATIGGTANANINNGSSDPDGDAIVVTQTPPGPYPVGATTVLLTVVDTKGATAQASATVTVLNPLTPAASLSANSLTFAVQGVGTASAAKSITVTNPGTAALTFSAAPTITGTNASDFAVASGTTCTNGSSVAASGGTCILNVTFTPGAVGARGTATLTLTDNASPSTQTITMTGTGDDFAVAGPGSSVTVTAGQTASFTVTVTPGSGGFPGAVSFSVSGLPTGAAATFTPTSVTPNGSAATTTLAVTTTSRTAELPVRRLFRPRGPMQPWGLLAMAVALVLAVLSLVKLGRRPLGQLVPAGTLIVLLLTAGYLSGCGGNSGPKTNPNGTPAGTSTLTITSSSGSLTHTTTVTLVVQ
jgi:hypothetical protein